MARIRLLLLLAFASVAAAQYVPPVFPPCSAVLTSNCTPVTDASGNLSIGTTFLAGDGAGAINLKAKGAKGDGTTDDTAAVQSAVTAAITGAIGQGATIFCPQGEYKITASIVAANVQGMVFAGSGNQCNFRWAGNNTDPLFLLQDVAYSTFRDFQIAYDGSHFLAEAFRMENGSGMSVSPGHNNFQGIYVEGGNVGIGIGFRISAVGAGGAANNDFHTFQNIRVANYTVAAFTIEGSQQHGISFINNNCDAFGGKYCVSGGSTAGAKAYFNWRGGFVGGASVADFFLTQMPSGEPSSIRDVGSEGSNRAIDYDGDGTATSPLTVEGYRYTNGSLNADGYAFKFRVPGPIVFRNSWIGNDSSKATKVLWNYNLPSSGPDFIFEGNTVNSTLTTMSAIFGTSRRLPTWYASNNACTAQLTCVDLSGGTIAGTDINQIGNTVHIDPANGATGLTFGNYSGGIGLGFGTFYPTVADLGASALLAWNSDVGLTRWAAGALVIDNRWDAKAYRDLYVRVIRNGGWGAGTEGGCVTNTNLVVDGANNQKVSSASYTFAAGDVGGWVDVTAGTGWTVGRYVITSVTAGVALLDASPAAVGTTGGTFVVNWDRMIHAHGTLGSTPDTFRICVLGASGVPAWTALY